MVSLSDAQLKTVMEAARGLPVEKRYLLLERIAARLQLRGRFIVDRLAMSALPPKAAK